MAASTAQQNAQEQPVPLPSQPLPPTPVSKQHLPKTHDHITTNLDTLFEDEGPHAPPAYQPVSINKAPSQTLRSEPGNPDRGSPLQIAQAKAAARQLLKMDAEHTRQRFVNLLCGVVVFFTVAFLLTTVGTSLFSRQAHKPHFGTTQAEAYNSSSDVDQNDVDYDIDARAKEDTIDEESFRAEAEDDATGPGAFPNDEVHQATGRHDGSSKGSREAFRAAETTEAAGATVNARTEAAFATNSPP